MVQIADATPEQGEAWTIHISSNTGQNMERNNNIESVPKAVHAAQDAQHDTPGWMDETYSPPPGFKRITQRAIEVYMLSKRPNGEMGGIGWWQTANGYTAMALHDLWASEDCNHDNLCSAIRKCEARHKNLINQFNDDTLWWAKLCCHMYSTNHDPWFLDQARVIWRHVSRSVCRRGDVFFEGKDMEGAVFWTTRPDEEQINAITTGLFAELSVRLALFRKTESESGDGEVSTEDYIEAAKCSLAWVLKHRYRPKQGIVLDNIKLKQGKAVNWVFTYNTGVAMGVCALLFKVTQHHDYLALARHMAIKAMTRTGPRGWIEDDGVLTEKHAFGRGTHDPMKPNDAVGFKAVLVRQLCTLYDILDSPECTDAQSMYLKDMVRKFININFRSQQERNTNGRGQYGPWWAGPFECPTSHAQMAVLDIMAAVRLVNR